jgi:hypothetical protein
MTAHGELAERMAQHKPGQLTWPDLTRFRMCGGCRFFQETRKANKGTGAPARGQCRQVKARYKVQSVEFDATARACPVFDR